MAQSFLVKTFGYSLSIENEIKKVIEWLDSGKVILTGIQDKYDYFGYIDNRTEEEKQPTTYKVASDSTTNNTKRHNEDQNWMEQKH